METKKHQDMMRAMELQARIFECVKEIRKCEDEIVLLGSDDIINSSEIKETLWSNLHLFQIGRKHRFAIPCRFDENPSFAVLSLLEERLRTTHLLGLQMRGCSIRIQDKNVDFCISGDVDAEIFGRTDERRQQHFQNKGKKSDL